MMLAQVIDEEAEMHDHQDYREALIRQQQRRLEVVSRRSYTRSAASDVKFVPDEPVSLRLCRVHDDPALEQLARLEGTRIHPGRYVVAEMNGVIVAAQPLDGGAPIADPFRRTRQVLPLLQLRVEQLAGPGVRHARRHVLSLRRSVI
jgi:hypothetical protein